MQKSVQTSTKNCALSKTGFKASHNNLMIFLRLFTSSEPAAVNAALQQQVTPGWALGTCFKGRNYPARALIR